MPASICRRMMLQDLRNKLIRGIRDEKKKDTQYVEGYHDAVLDFYNECEKFIESDL